jgi:hypothetical protein
MRVLRDLVKHPLFTILVAWLGAAAIAERTADLQPRHDLSIAIIRSDSAATLSPESVGKYSYRVLIRNNGDFPETSVLIDVAVEPEDPGPLPATGWKWSASSSFVLDSLVIDSDSDSVEADAPYRVPRLNPDEWVSFAATWPVEMELVVVVRTSEITEEAQT